MGDLRKALRRAGVSGPSRGPRPVVTLADLQEDARRFGGECLADRYVNNRQVMPFRCAVGHVFEMRVNDVRNGHWCGDCGPGRGERITRAYFEQLFGQAFPRCRPEWLRSEQDNPMELDGYCEALALAFEHQGGQHEAGHVFHREPRSVHVKRLRRDRLKARLCRKRGVVLIAVPAIPRPLHPDKLRGFIASECERWGVPLPRDFDTRPVDLRPVMSVSDAKLLEELRALVASRWNGGEVLSTTYLGAQVEHEFRCACGCVFEATPASIRYVRLNGTSRWCPECRGTRPLGLDRLRALAAERSGECLATRYLNQHQLVRWRCERRHEFTMCPKHVRRGQWCPTCGRAELKRKLLRYTIEDLQRHAASRGGHCRSPLFLGVSVEHEWECGKGHRWPAVPNNVLRGAWCGRCKYAEQGQARRADVTRVAELAEERGGHAAIERYTNKETPIPMRCAAGHSWEGRTRNVLKGSWCRECAGSREAMLAVVRAVARARGGRCESERFAPGSAKLDWSCGCGRRWKATAKAVLAGEWCERCQGGRVRVAS